MDIKETFLKLTSRTYPYGTESELLHLLPSILEKDEFDNLFIKIGESDVMFTSHLDTATSALTEIKHTFNGNIIETDGTTILGADDKSGVTIMLYMIENKIPGLYYFFLGEEVGCIGSKKLRDKLTTNKIDGINKVVSFDRRGTSSVITFQASSRCCSDKFGEALSKELNDSESSFSYKNDPTGVYTDSAQFTRIYPECTNISVGYQNEHTFRESQDIDHLIKLANACLKVNWNSLPVERDPSTTEYSRSGYYGYGWGDDDYESEYSYGYGRSSYGKYLPGASTTQVAADKEWFHDRKFNHVSCFEIDRLTKKVISVDLCEMRILFETQIIEDLMRSLDVNFVSLTWNGFKLIIKYADDSNLDGYTTTCNRNDLMEYLPELDYGGLDEIGGIDENEFLNTSGLL